MVQEKLSYTQAQQSRTFLRPALADTAAGNLGVSALRKPSRKAHIPAMPGPEFSMYRSSFCDGQTRIFKVQAGSAM
jgi:hypothetical protein